MIPLYVANIKEGEAPTTLTVRGDQGFGSTNTVNVGAKIWVQGVSGTPEPVEIIALGKDRAFLIMRPGIEKWEYVPQEKYSRVIYTVLSFTEQRCTYLKSWNPWYRVVGRISGWSMDTGS